MTSETTSAADASQKQARSATATTTDAPAFGWSSYAERVNGRFAMIGFVAVVLVELDLVDLVVVLVVVLAIVFS